MRSAAIDRVRGLAIALMISDHVALFLGADWWRWTAGRVSMPLFFVLAGSLVTRLTYRHAVAAGIGLVLPLAVPWIDAPNVLVVYAVGAVVLVAARRASVPAWLVAAVCLALAANRVDVTATGYEAAGLLGLMALGAAVGNGWARGMGEGLGEWMRRLGVAPLRWYVGHLVALEGLRLWLLKG